MLEEKLLAMIKVAVKEAVADAMGDHDRQSRTLPDYLTPRETADRARLALQTVYQRHSQGTIPGAIRDGGKLLFHRATIDKWIAAGCPKNTVLCKHSVIPVIAA